MKIIYKILQKIKENSFMYPGTRELVKRKYLTRSGIKEWYELTLEDKLCLNIKL